MRPRWAFLDSESANDLVEYTLLLAFLTLGCVALMIDTGQSVSQIWESANSKLKKGHAYAHGKGHGSGNPIK